MRGEEETAFKAAISRAHGRAKLDGVAVEVSHIADPLTPGFLLGRGAIDCPCLERAFVGRLHVPGRERHLEGVGLRVGPRAPSAQKQTVSFEINYG